jgi:hypothetical protein
MSRISELLKTYDAMGPHRTGRPQDPLVSQWMQELLSEQGLEVHTQDFALMTLDTHQCWLLLGEHRFELMPCQDTQLPEHLSLEGTIGFAEPCDIRLTQVSTMGNQQLGDIKRSSNAAAMIIFTMGSREGLTPLNADEFETPFAQPGFFVSGEHRNQIRTLLKAHGRARIESSLHFTPARSTNIVATKRGTQPHLSPIIVFTPRTGWWHCAAERGGGVACLLHMAQRLRGTALSRSIVFLVTSGHELGYLGMQRASIEWAESREAHLWLHLGANFAAAQDSLFFMQASTQALQEQYLEQLQCFETHPDIVAPTAGELSGEGAFIPRRSDYISIQGGNGFFHHIDDRYEAAVDVGKLQGICEATLAFLIKQAA